jgi:hypothetical protein
VRDRLVVGIGIRVDDCRLNLAILDHRLAQFAQPSQNRCRGAVASSCHLHQIVRMRQAPDLLRVRSDRTDRKMQQRQISIESALRCRFRRCAEQKIQVRCLVARAKELLQVQRWRAVLRMRHGNTS